MTPPLIEKPFSSLPLVAEELLIQRGPTRVQGDPLKFLDRHSLHRALRSIDERWKSSAMSSVIEVEKSANAGKRTKTPAKIGKR
jgi:hypothetical protein